MPRVEWWTLMDQPGPATIETLQKNNGKHYCYESNGVSKNINVMKAIAY